MKADSLMRCRVGMKECVRAYPGALEEGTVAKVAAAAGAAGAEAGGKGWGQPGLHA